MTKQSLWKWADKLTKTHKRLKRSLNQVRLFKKRIGRVIRYKFGVRVPRTTQEAYHLDKLAGNNKWRDSIEKEVKLLRDVYGCFRVPEDPDTEITAEYQKVPLLWVYDVKFDGRYRSRCVAGGHMTADLEYDLYSGVVDLENVRIAFVIAALMNLKVIAADIGSAYIQSLTIEKIYCVPGIEFGPWAGIKVIVVKALYGLKASSACWHQKCADSPRDMGFVPSKADYDLWMRQRGDHYEYVAVLVDDLLVFSREPETIIGPLEDLYKYELKGVGEPEYYSGADMKLNPETQLWEMSAKSYLQGVCDRIEKLLEVKLKSYGSPLIKDDHPEADTTDFLVGDEITKYQMLVGCAQWAVTLGRYDIQYAVNTLARFGMKPREGHLKRMLRVFGYLKSFIKARTVFDPSSPNLDCFNYVENDWAGLYAGSEEDIDPKAPEPLSELELDQTVLMDASHGGDLDTRKSVSAYVKVLGKTVVKTYSKRQHTVETSTYGSELVAARVAVEAVLAMRYKLRMLGVKVTKPAVILCDNMSVVHQMQLPSSALKKKHLSLAWHRCREAVSLSIVKFAHIGSKWNMADLGTKAKGPEDFYRLLAEPLYGRGSPSSGTTEEPAPESRGVAEGDSVPGQMVVPKAGGGDPSGVPGEVPGGWDPQVGPDVGLDQH